MVFVSIRPANLFGNDYCAPWADPWGRGLALSIFLRNIVLFVIGEDSP